MALVVMWAVEQPRWADIVEATGGILYSAVFSCGIAYTLQILGQKITPPALASILMCMESVFAVVSDAIVLKTPLRLEEVFGCVILFVSLVVCSLAEQKKPSGSH
jgi:drug/metabolite transporter (DMT)-like permease